MYICVIIKTITFKSSIMKTTDNTIGKKINGNEEYSLNIENKNGDSRVYYGKTKKEATKNFRDQYPYFTKNIISKDWNIEKI